MGQVDRRGSPTTRRVARPARFPPAVVHSGEGFAEPRPWPSSLRHPRKFVGRHDVVPMTGHTRGDAKARRTRRRTRVRKPRRKARQRIVRYRRPAALTRRPLPRGPGSGADVGARRVERGPARSIVPERLARMSASDVRRSRAHGLPTNALTLLVTCRHDADGRSAFALLRRHIAAQDCTGRTLRAGLVIMRSRVRSRTRLRWGCFPADASRPRGRALLPSPRPHGEGRTCSE
jgi:hypothetical protein